MFIESVGINARSSFFSGVNEKRVKLFAYMFCGFCAGIAGLVAELEHPDIGRQQHRAQPRARCHPRRRHRRDGARGGRSVLALRGDRRRRWSSRPSRPRCTPSASPANALLAIKGIVVIVVILLLSDQVRNVDPPHGLRSVRRRHDGRSRARPAFRSGRASDATGGSHRCRRRSSCSPSPMPTAR